MNRWLGSKADSDRQNSQRDQRAARRYIRNTVATAEANLNDSVASADFHDCEDPLLPSVDGQADDMADAAARARVSWVGKRCMYGVWSARCWLVL